MCKKWMECNKWKWKQCNKWVKPARWNSPGRKPESQISQVARHPEARQPDGMVSNQEVGKLDNWEVEKIGNLQME